MHSTERITGIGGASWKPTHGPFLQLPFRYGIPLALASGLLHWLASQSFFAVSLVRASDIIDVDTHTNDHHEGFLSCGFSSLAMLMLLAGLLLLLLVFLVTALPRFENGMPMVGACSAAIAAACHSVSESPNDIHTLPLCWGVISTSADGEVSCAFSAEDVPFPRQSMPFSLWQEKTASALNEEGLARFILAEREIQPMPAAHFSKYNTAVEMVLGARSLWKYRKDMKRWTAAREDTTEQAALREILKRIMYNIWGVWATYQLASAREMWVYLEDQFTERQRANGRG